MAGVGELFSVPECISQMTPTPPPGCAGAPVFSETEREMATVWLGRVQIVSADG